MDDTLLLDSPWPPDLDPATVPFRTRSVTILRRMGYFDDWTLFNTLTEAEVWGWWHAGVGPVGWCRWITPSPNVGDGSMCGRCVRGEV